ncbi:TPA: ATP-binding cassette domain-containing protein [Enterococcus faecium]
MSLVRYCFKVTRKKIFLFTYIALQLLVSVLSSIMPIINGSFVDAITIADSTSIIFQFISAVLLFYILQLIMTYFLQMLAVALSSNFIFTILSEFVIKVQKIPISKSNRINEKIISQELIYDSQALASFFLESCSIIPSNLSTFLFSFVALLFLDFTIASLVLIFFVLYLAYNTVVKPILEKKQRSVKDLQALFYSKLQEQMGMIKLIKVFSLYDYTESQLFESFKLYRSSLVKLKRTGYLFFVGDSTFATSIQILIFLLAGSAIIKGELTVGQFTMILSYFSMMISSSKFVSAFSTQYADANSSLSRIKKYQYLDVEKDGNVIIEDVSRITLENVSFDYEENSEFPIIKNFNYSFEKGKIYCILGYNGSGKSTLLDIIMGLYQDTVDGRILYDNVDFERLHKHNLYSKIITHVPQSPNLFNLELEDNICLNYPEDTWQKAVPFLELFKIEEIVNREKNAHDKDIFSGGETQKISLIRSLVRKNKVLVLDEPTNHLDFNAKQELLNLLKKEKNKKIIIISSHDYDIEMIADEIINL